jgi:hypothetical protein
LHSVSGGRSQRDHLFLDLIWRPTAFFAPWFIACEMRDIKPGVLPGRQYSAPDIILDTRENDCV